MYHSIAVLVADVPSNRNGTTVRFDLTGQYFNQGGFAGTVGTKDAQDFSTVGFQRNIL